MKEKPKKIKVESRTSRTERSSFRERRPKEEREQFDKPRSNRGDRKERKPKKYDEKQKEVSFSEIVMFITVGRPYFLSMGRRVLSDIDWLSNRRE